MTTMTMAPLSSSMIRRILMLMLVASIPCPARRPPGGRRTPGPPPAGASSSCRRLCWFRPEGPSGRSCSRGRWRGHRRRRRPLRHYCGQKFPRRPQMTPALLLLLRPPPPPLLPMTLEEGRQDTHRAPPGGGGCQRQQLQWWTQPRVGHASPRMARMMPPAPGPMGGWIPGSPPGGIRSPRAQRRRRRCRGMTGGDRPVARRRRRRSRRWAAAVSSTAVGPCSCMYVLSRAVYAPPPCLPVFCGGCL